jgi:hypothetical protein
MTAEAERLTTQADMAAEASARSGVTGWTGNMPHSCDSRSGRSPS